MTGMDFFQSIGEIDEACLAGFDGGETASGRENAGGKSEIECKKAYRSYRRIVMAAAIALLLTVSAIWYMAAQRTACPSISTFGAFTSIWTW